MMNRMQEVLFPVTLEYRKHWSYWEAIREIKQNALDETGSYEERRDGSDTVIMDNGHGLEFKDLLLGKTSKDGRSTRGRFGEGLKIALVIFERLGHHVTIRSNHSLITSSIGEIDGEPCLKITIEETEQQQKGTLITLQGYLAETYEDRFIKRDDERILFSNDGLHTSILSKLRFSSETYRSSILGKAALFVRDIYVQDLTQDHPALFGYNLWDVKLEESRQIADASSVTRGIGTVWSEVGDQPLIERLLQGMWSNPKCYERMMLMYNRPRHPSAWQEAWISAFGKSAVLATSSTASSEAEWRGATLIDFGSLGYFGFQDAVQTDVKYVREDERTEKDQALKVDSLDEQSRQTLDLLQTICHELAPDYRVAPFRMSVAGKCSRFHKLIKINSTVLKEEYEALKTLVHELAHARYNATDNTHEMFRALESVGADICVECYGNETGPQ